MFLNEDLSEYQKTKTTENFNPRITQKHPQFSNNLYDTDDINDFFRFTDMININTFGSQPIIMYRKAKKLYSPNEEKRINKKVVAKSQEKILINNYIKTNFMVDGGLPQKVNKYKSNMINVHSQSPINKNQKKFKSKTNRNTGNTKSRPKTQKALGKNKEFIPKTAKTNIRQKNNINNNLNLKREKTNPNLKYNYKNNNIIKTNHKTKKNEKKQSNNIIDNNINNNKYKSDKNTIENEKKQEKQKNDYMNDLIKNAIVGFTKELNKKKKNSENKKVTERKLDYLLENGIDHNCEDELENGIVVMGKSKDKNLFKIKKIKPKKKIKIEKINTNNINNIDINYHTENDKFIYNNLTSSNNQILTSELSKNLTKNKNISSNNNLNSEIEKINLEQETRKKICNPKIDQFEYLEKIRNNFKKIRNQKQKLSPELINNSNSFKFSHLKKLTNKLVNKKQNNISNNNNIKLNPKKNLQEIENIQKNDEFLYADRVSHRTQTELKKFRKKKKMEQRKEQNEEMRKKQDKIMNTLQNLIKLGDEYQYNNNSNNSPLKIRNDSKNHVKKRKVLNEYYVGTEESKNNTSTFIDKQEYYKSIIESKNVLNYSKVEKTETNVDEINGNKIFNINNNENNLRKLSSDNFYDITMKNNANNSSKGFDNKLTELKAKVINTIKRSSELFNKENIKRIKSDLYENNNLIKAKFENKVFNKDIYKKNNFMNNKNNIDNNKDEKSDKNSEEKMISFLNRFNIFIKKRFLERIKSKYNEVKSQEKSKKFKAGFDYLIFICKFYQYQTILNYSEAIKCSFALKKLIKPFIRQQFSIFINKLKYFTKIKFLIKALTHIYKYKIMQKLFKYCAVIDFWKNIIIPGGIRLQHFILKKCFKKIKQEDKLIDLDINYNVNRNIISRSYLHSHIINEEKKANSYIYESLDCADSISVHPNSLDNDGLHQLKEIIEMQNENRLEDSSLENGINEESGRMYGIRTNSNNSINTLDSINNQIVASEENSSLNDNNNNNENQIKTEFHIKDTLLKKIINNNDTVDKKNINENNKKIIEQPKKDENDDFITTKINEEKDKNEKSNKIPLKEEIIKNLDNYIKNNQSENSNSIINNQENKNKLNPENIKNIISQIPDKKKFAEELTEKIISKILSEQGLKSYQRLFPKKSSDFNYQKYSLFDQSLLTNNNISELSNTLESLTGSSLVDSSQLLEKSMIFQYSISSEFNKTISEKKNKLETNLYNECIIEKLILLILKEIKNKYGRIYDNISVPYKANYEQIIVASYLQDNELLNDCYKELKVKEDLKSILNKKELLEKFNVINKKIRKKKGLEEDNYYDNLINECIIDATIEILNKERAYGEQGEPFPFSKRAKELCFKYNRNDPKPLMRHVYKEIKKMLFGKGNIIKENSPIFDKNDPFLMNIFKKEMEGQDIWSELEIQEEQVKSIASSIIFEQLINEVIEILEHVQLNRKRPELYQDKSIYACDDIPRLSFQMISTNTENDND